MPPEIVLFVFRRRGTRTISVRRTCLDAGHLVGSLLGMPRRRNTKRRGTICVLPYKQDNPGVGVEKTNGQPRHGGALRDVDNDKALTPRSAPMVAVAADSVPGARRKRLVITHISE